MMTPRKVVRTDKGAGMSDEERMLKIIANLQRDVERLKRSQTHPNYTGVADGRLSLTTDASDLSNKTDQDVLYYIPYKGNKVLVPDDADNPGNGAWRVAIIPEGDDVLSIDFNALAPGPSAWDIGVYWDNGLQIDSLRWTNLTTRATSLTRIGGKLTYPVADSPTRTYVGTVWVDAAHKLQDNGGFRRVWNYYNQVTKLLTAAAGTTVYWITGQNQWINIISVDGSYRTRITSRNQQGGRNFAPTAGYVVHTDFVC
jgi:hypothetical protein